MQMDLFKDDIESLVEETFFLAENPVLEKDSAPELPGIIYRIEKGVNTFCLRMAAHLDLKAALKLIEEGDDELHEKLKIEENQEDIILEVYPVENLFEAESICSTLAQRRFPLDEKALCNISDPGFYWWLSTSEGKLTVYFQSYGALEDASVEQIGPLFDAQVFRQVIGSVAQAYWQKNGVTNFLASRKSITWEGNAEVLHELSNWFSKGDIPASLIAWAESKGMKSLTYLVQEVASNRRFWREIQQQL